MVNQEKDLPKTKSYHKKYENQYILKKLVDSATMPF